MTLEIPSDTKDIKDTWIIPFTAYTRSGWEFLCISSVSSPLIQWISIRKDRAKERTTQRQEKLSAREEREANKWGRRGGWVDEQQAILSRWREGQKRKLAENLSRHMFNIMAHLQPNTQKCVFGVTQMVRMKAGTAEEKYNNLRMNCSQVIVGSNTKNQTRNKKLQTQLSLCWSPVLHTAAQGKQQQCENRN